MKTLRVDRLSTLTSRVSHTTKHLRKYATVRYVAKTTLLPFFLFLIRSFLPYENIALTLSNSSDKLSIHSLIKVLYSTMFTLFAIPKISSTLRAVISVGEKLPYNPSSSALPLSALELLKRSFIREQSHLEWNSGGGRRENATQRFSENRR